MSASPHPSEDEPDRPANPDQGPSSASHAGQGPSDPAIPPPAGDSQAGGLISRRRLLEMIRAAGVTAALAAYFPGLIEKVPQGAERPAPDPAVRIRKWAMVIDLRRCDGCQAAGLPPQCTQACIEGHYAPEPMEWIQVYEEELPTRGTRFIPTPCMQCQNAPCVNVCPVAATFATPEGTILIDQERCIGCRACMAACPYDRRFFNWAQPPAPAESQVVAYDPEHQAPARRGTVMKCDFCPDLARAGKLPYCAQACPTNAIYYGDLEEDLATNGEEVVQLSRLVAEGDGFRLKEHLGTQPRVFYLPGHGDAVGRHPGETGRQPTEWRWQETLEGASRWQRSGS